MTQLVVSLGNGLVLRGEPLSINVKQLVTMEKVKPMYEGSEITT